ncbi:hypothetical protein BDB01DRAFT_782107 [Pilobolus umbonatus]|nr:hypothetical protein BDB01DRAFT_782107 [Pilobolus umbonatus]
MATVNSNPSSKLTISQRRATYPLQERLKMYNPDTMARRINQQANKLPNKLIVHGVNILNKVSVDTDIAMNRIKQRKATHNRIERRRRDNLNTLVNELSDVIPLLSDKDDKCHRAKILRHAIDYIRTIKDENTKLREQLGLPESSLHLSESSCSSQDDSDTSFSQTK